MSRRRRQQRLERVLGTPALFSTAYGNVGSSIYYALGVTAVFALGLTPIVFVIAGVIFAATAATYAEGTVRFPEAGGSSSFARHAFNELVSFGAAWAQMLNYIITIAISAFFVPHYLSIFWAPLRENPWDIVGGGIVIVLLVTLNIVGIQESARVNIGLALIDFATQVLLVLLGFALIFSPHVLGLEHPLGRRPDVEPVPPRDPGGDDRLHRDRDRLEPGRGGARPGQEHPAGDQVRGGRRLRHLLHAAVDRALGAAGHEDAGRPLPDAARAWARRTGFSNDPVLGLVENLGVHGAALSALKIYVGLLAATILFIATNAGVIGASRITYAMASYRQLPEVFRRLHKRFKTPYISLLVFAGVIPMIVLLPGKTSFLGTMYSFGAMLSFTVAHASIVALRYKHRDEELIFRARPNLRLRGVDWPLFAIFGGLGTALSWLVVVEQEAPTRWAGLGWLAAGFVMYAVYRRRVVHAPLIGDGARAGRDRAGGGARVPERARPGRLAARVGGGRRPRLPPGRRARRGDRRADRARGPARAAARRRASRPRGAQGARPARRGARDRRRLRRGRGRHGSCAPGGRGARSSRRPSGATARSS